MERTRRRTVLGLVSTGAASAAGCLSALDADDGSDENTDSDEPEPTESADGVDEDPETAATPATKWAMYGNDATNTFSTDHDGPTGEPEIDWSVSTGDGITLETAPVIQGDTVYVADDRNDSDTDVRAIDTETGTEQWARELSVSWGTRVSLALDDETLYAAGSEVFALDPTDGAVAWQAGSDEARFSSDFLCVGSDTAVYSASSLLVAVDIESESVRWERELDGRPEPPAIADETVYVGSRSGNYLVALSLADGTERWRRDGGSKSAPSIGDDGIYFGTGFDAVAVDTAGETLWRERIGGTVDSPPAIDGREGMAYYPGTGRVASHDTTTGERSWVEDVDGGLRTGVFTSETFYTGSSEGVVYAFDRETGTIEWQLTVSDRISDAPAVADGTLYVVDGEGVLYAIR